VNAPARTPRHSGQWYTFVVLIALVVIALIVLLVLGLTGNLTSSSNAKVTSQGPGGSSPAEQQFCRNLAQAGQATGQLRSSLQTRRRSVINDARRNLNTAIGNLNDANLPVDHAAVSELVSQASTLQQAVIHADQQNLSAASVAAVQAPLNQTQRQVLVVQRSASFCTAG
jgi:hypothetical protein